MAWPQNKAYRRSTRVTAATPWFIIKMLTPWSRHFEYYQGGECLSNAHWLGPWRQHLMTNYGLRQNHRKNQEVCLLCTLFCGVAAVMLFFSWINLLHGLYSVMQLTKYCCREITHILCCVFSGPPMPPVQRMTPRMPVVSPNVRSLNHSPNILI
jgi:hypothetical protein